MRVTKVYEAIIRPNHDDNLMTDKLMHLFIGLCILIKVVSRKYTRIAHHACAIDLMTALTISLKYV